VLHTDLAKELLIQPKAMEFALGQEVRNFGDTTVSVPTEVLDEGMLVLVVLEGQHDIRSNGTGGMQDPRSWLSTKPNLGIGDDLGRHDFRDRANHVVSEGVEVEVRIYLCDTRAKSPNVPLG